MRPVQENLILSMFGPPLRSLPFLCLFVAGISCVTEEIKVKERGFELEKPKTSGGIVADDQDDVDWLERWVKKLEAEEDAELAKRRPQRDAFSDAIADSLDT